MQEPHQQSLLLQEVTRQLLVLEEAIANVNQTRKQLKQRSVEMKSDIQTSVSRQLETLKQHEASLLRQVDLIQQAKDAALQGQEDKLHEALGSLTVAMQVEEGQTTSPVKDVLQRLKSLKMKPMETPTLSLKPDLMHADMQSSSSIGGFLFGGMFDSGASSVSLPKLFEDYGDDEHHVLYRTVAESIGDANREISVRVPQLSQRPEDWLFMPTEDLTPSRRTTAPGHILFPPFMTGSLKECLNKHDDLSRVSIHQWLCDIQQQTDVEEEEADFDVLSSSAFLAQTASKDSSIEVLSAEEATPAITIGSLGTSTTLLNTAMPSMLSSSIQISEPTAWSYFNQVMSAPTTGWLLLGHDGVPSTSATYCHEVLQYFHQVSNDTKMWLQKYTEKKQREEESDAFNVDGTAASPALTETFSRDGDVWLLMKNDSTAENDKRDNSHDKKKDRADNTEDGVHVMVQKDDAANTNQEGLLCHANDECSTQVGQQHIPDVARCCVKSEKSMSSSYSARSCPSGRQEQQEQATQSYFEFVLQQDTGNWLLGGVSAKGVSPVGNENKPSYHFAFTPFISNLSNDGCWLLQGARVPPYSSDGDLVVAVTDKQIISPSEFNDVISLEGDWKARFTHRKTSASDQNLMESSNIDGSGIVKSPGKITNSEWLLNSDLESVTSHDQSKWLLPDDSGVADTTLDQVWLFVSDVASSSEGVSSEDYSGNLFKCFQQFDDDTKCWLVSEAQVE